MKQQELFDYRSCFGEYLSKTPRYRNAEATAIDALIDYVEQTVCDILRANSNETHEQIYEYQAKQELSNILNSMLSGGKLHDLYTSSDGLIYDSLELYIGFLDSKYHPLSEKQKKNKKKEKKTIPEPQPYEKQEGAKHEDTVIRYERDRGNRKDCIAHYGYICQVCGMDFEKHYGELGKEFIEVHHLHPVSQGERKVNPIVDLIPLCSNCHSMIHRQEDVSDWKGLKQKYEQCKDQNN